MKLTGEVKGYNVRFRNFKKIYGNKPVPTVIRYNKKSENIKISYTMDAVYMKNDKINPEWKSIIEHDWKCVEKPMSFLDAVKNISESSLYIGPDNGISHLCRSIGTPMILLEYKKPIIEAFPNTNEYVICRTNEEIQNQIKTIRNIE